MTHGTGGKAEDVRTVCLESAQLRAGSGVPKFDDSHRVPRNNRSVAMNVERHSDELKDAIDIPEHTDRPHKRSLPSRLVRSEPICDSARSEVPLSDTAVSASSYEPVIRPIIVFIIGTIVGLWGDSSGGKIAAGNWGTPSNAEEAGFDLS